MRLLVCLIGLLCGCSTSAVRCDAHLGRINATEFVGAPAQPSSALSSPVLLWPAPSARSLP